MPFGLLSKGARQERQRQLSRICDRLEHLESAPPPAPTPQQRQGLLEVIRAGLDERLDGVETRFQAVDSFVAGLDAKIKTLTFGVEEGIQRTDRAERRIHATIKRARKELAEHGYESPGLDVEAETLRLVDGGRSEEGEVPALPAGVEPPVEEGSSIKGVPAETLRRVRGF